LVVDLNGYSLIGQLVQVEMKKLLFFCLFLFVQVVFGQYPIIDSHIKSEKCTSKSVIGFAVK
jgi:hypothetical protein